MTRRRPRPIRAELRRPGDGTVQVGIHIPLTTGGTYSALWPAVPVERLPEALEYLKARGAEITTMQQPNRAARRAAAKKKTA